MPFSFKHASVLVGAFSALFVAFDGFGAAAQARAVEEGIVPHRALYKISMHRSAANADVVAAGGTMAFEWRDDCSGWGVEQRYRMEFHPSEGNAYLIQSSFSTWESKDGDTYRFIVDRNVAGNREQIEGRASLALPLGSKGGKANFKTPEEAELALGKQSLFPTEHTLRVLEMAMKGKRFYRAFLFDGSEVEPEVLVSAVIGKRTEAPFDLKHDAISGSYWPINLAFFGADKSATEPTFEMAVDLQANGIGRKLIVDYGNFSIRMDLERLEVLPAPNC
jgi:hypothetical protein